MVKARPPKMEVRMKLRVFKRIQSVKIAAGRIVAGPTKLRGEVTNTSHCSHRPSHETSHRPTAVYVHPVGNFQASHWMYWRADGMMIMANGVRVIHHCRSFQSVQKSQSPANSSLVMSAAAATTGRAVTQKTRSHL